MTDHKLRPIERTVQRLQEDGLSNSEVAWRLRRSPGYVRRVEMLSGMERPARVTSGAETGRLRPIERCVLNSLEAGAGYAENRGQAASQPNLCDAGGAARQSQVGARSVLSIPFSPRHPAWRPRTHRPPSLPWRRVCRRGAR